MPVSKRKLPTPETVGIPEEEVARTKAVVDAGILRSIALSKEEERDALDREIELKRKHFELDQLSGGKYPESLESKDAAKTGFWKLVAFVLRILGKFI